MAGQTRHFLRRVHNSYLATGHKAGVLGPSHSSQQHSPGEIRAMEHLTSPRPDGSQEEREGGEESTVGEERDSANHRLKV